MISYNQQSTAGVHTDVIAHGREVDTGNRIRMCIVHFSENTTRPLIGHCWRLLLEEVKMVKESKVLLQSSAIGGVTFTQKRSRKGNTKDLERSRCEIIRIQRSFRLQGVSPITC